MLDHTLNKLIGTAITDKQFGALLLANPRATARRFGLATEEVEAVASIHASTLSEFAQRLDEWMTQRQRRLRGNVYWPERSVPTCVPALAIIDQADLTAAMANN
ncbi:MAG: Os1348 family NHLP clan protein [Chloroflexota bacterium]|nr:Os1348 family NHLP clan protein [Chloroflexota bacterium]